MRHGLLRLCGLGLLLGAGCAHNRSQLQPFAQYAGQSVTLKRDIGLWFSPNAVYVAHYHLSDGDPVGDAKRVATLPKGTQLFIRKTVMVMAVDAAPILAIGEVTNPLTGNRVRFEYAWNYSAGPDQPILPEGIGRAPWEGEEIPSYRYVGYYGNSYDPGRDRP